MKCKMNLKRPDSFLDTDKICGNRMVPEHLHFIKYRLGHFGKFSKCGRIYFGKGGFELYIVQKARRQRVKRALNYATTRGHTDMYMLLRHSAQHTY